MKLQARVRVWGRPRGRSGYTETRVSLSRLAREDARVGAGSENYVKFRGSFNKWIDNGPIEGESEPRGTKIGQYGRLQPDIWGAVYGLLDKGVCQELKVEWGEIVPSTGAYAYQRSIMVDCQVGADREVTHARLANLGYRFNVSSDQEFEVAVIRFQGDYGIDGESGLVSGALPPKTRSKLDACFQSAFDAPQGNGGSSATDADPQLPLTPCGPDGGLV